MSAATIVYTTYISTTPEKIWADHEAGDRPPILGARKRLGLETGLEVRACP
jgi:hypothetical protein